MTDERLRELERRWKETGSVEDEAKFLAERMRVGDLTKERLELAAYCGQPAASMAISLTPSASLVDSDADLEKWVRGLERWGPEVSVRAAIAAANTALRKFVERVPDDTIHRSVLASAEAWLACPCREHGERARDLAQSDTAVWARGTHGEVGGVLHRAPSSIWSAAMAAHAAQKNKRMGRRVNEAAQAAIRAADVTSVRHVHEVIATALAEWALGHRGTSQ